MEAVLFILSTCLAERDITDDAESTYFIIIVQTGAGSIFWEESDVKFGFALNAGGRDSIVIYADSKAWHLHAGHRALSVWAQKICMFDNSKLEVIGVGSRTLGIR